MFPTRTLRAAAVLTAATAFLSTAGAQTQSHALVPNSQVIVPASTSTFTGSFGFVFAITVTSTVPADYVITCMATVTPIDASALFTTDSETVVATRSGSSATCSFPIRYSWNLSSGADMVNTSYIVTATPATPSTTGGALVARIAAGALPSVTVPPTATSLWRNVAVTL
jgi:hypothetical protein